MSTNVRRDPFARGSYRRVTHTSGKCHWCGNRKRRLYSYTWESDDRPLRDGSVLLSRVPFCDFECFRSYFS